MALLAANNHESRGGAPIGNQQLSATFNGGVAAHAHQQDSWLNVDTSLTVGAQRERLEKNTLVHF